MAALAVERERAEGFENLRRGFLLLSVASAINLVLVLLSLSIHIEEARATAVPRSLALWGLVAGLLAIALFILGVLSWVFRIIGWGKLCKGVGKKFYCHVRTILVLLPILGAVVAAATIALLVVEVLSLGPAVGVLGLERAKGLIVYFVLGAVLVTVSFVIEGVALLDLSYVLGSALLGKASMLYVAAHILSALGSLVGTLRLAPIVKSAFGALAPTLALLSASMLYWALRAGGGS